jgi:hypothetical protein
MLLLLYLFHFIEFELSCDGGCKKAIHPSIRWGLFSSIRRGRQIGATESGGKRKKWRVNNSAEHHFSTNANAEMGEENDE